MRKVCVIIGILMLVLVVISAVIALADKSSITKDKIALVRVEGAIFDSKNAVEELKGYLKDTSIKAIVLRVDSPGGAVGPSQEIYDFVKKAASEKKIIVSMGSVAASGGYYIAAPATRIVANPGTLTGSIGVIMEIPNVEGLMTKIGVKSEVVKSGKHKDLASMFRKMEDEERGILQNVLDDVHEQFIEAVSKGRAIPIETVRILADGRVFTGRQAKELKLVDELGNLEYAITLAGRLAGIKGEPEVVTKKEKFGFMDVIRGKVSSELRDLVPSVQLKYMLSP